MKVPEDEIWSLGKTMFQAVKFGRFQLTPRVAKPSLRDEGTHATNVALLTAAMALEAGYSDELCMEATAAALMHDIGQFLLPEEIRGLPDFKLTPQQLPIAQNHAYAGALLLLGAGCPGLWVSAALEHHRCLDGGSYPELSTSDQPHELVRMIALANYFDSKRAVIDGFAEEPADIVLGAKGLASNYFGDGVLQCFLKSVGVYPPGLSVSLSDGETAVVERAEPSDPWRPSVRMLTGAQAGEVVDLRDVDKSHGTYKRSILWADVPMLLNESSGVMNPWELTSLA
jgi:HD-GYP domain-containing protein (c-di-GMP phosphodiesterase class II)